MTFNIINTNKQLYTINGNNLIIDNSIKLGDVIDRLPSGLIDKKATGIGATTCELTSPRNSIIVVPTRALAYTKSQTHPDSFYLGSPYGEIKNKIKDSDINNYINSPIKYKKFLVVADSLPRLLNHIGDSVYNDYFIMIDEIDSFQSEIGYRPKMELSLDYFFKFKERCLVSATLIEFSNPKIQHLPRIVIDYTKRDKKQLNIINSPSNPIKIVAELILDYKSEKIIWDDIDKDSNKKLLIAYNSVESIMEVISLLPIDLRAKCKVLCSEKSRFKTTLDTIEYYDELNNNLLPAEINFITSTYFVGVDIDEIFCPILINDSKAQHSFLSLEKMTQIAGRCRLDLQSIYVIFSKSNFKVLKATKDELIETAKNQLRQISNMVKSSKNVSLKGESLKVKVESLIDFFSPQALCKFSNMEEIEVSYLAIDHELIKIQMITEIYRSLESFCMNALNYGYDVKIINTHAWLKSCIDNRIINNYHNEKEKNSDTIKSNFINDLNSDVSNVELLKYTKSNTGNELYNFYSNLSKGIEGKAIAVYIKENYLGSPNTKKLQKISRSYKYFMAEDYSDWKVNITNEFPDGAVFTSNQILKKLQMVQSILGTFDKSIGRIETKTKATQLLSELKMIKRFQKRDGDQRINVYKIIGDNPMGFIRKPRYSMYA
ncbi:MAG: hypothetical protein IPI30_09485 [Saprospiraceae bacterium]|nr:hypothetical protein [Candidatus Vicinibacter affinis]